MNGSHDNFDAEDMSLVRQLQEEFGGDDGNLIGEGDDNALTDAQAATDTGAQSEGAGNGQQADATSSNANDDAAQAAQATPAAQQSSDAAPAATEQNDSNQDGNVRAALRASRRAEQRARQEAERMRAEMEELRKQLPAGTTDANGDPDMAALEADYPGIAAVVKKQAQQIAELSKTTPQAAQQQQADVEFTPPALPVAVQEVVDEIPQLLALQHSADQTGWQLAVKYEASLRNSPDWEGKTDAERFSEAARLAASKLSPAASTPHVDQAAAARAAAAAKAASAARATPESLSDFGGAAVETPGSNLSRFARMTDEQVIDDLNRLG